MAIVVGTEDGAQVVGGGRSLAGRAITALTPGEHCVWGIADGSVIVRAPDVARAEGSAGDLAWVEVVGSDDPPRCLLPTSRGVLVGTGSGGLAWWRGGTVLEAIESFDDVEGRDRWWQVPGLDLGPNTRSLAEAPDGTLYVNVHVGGIYRSRDRGATWEPTIDQETDVHQVRAFAGGLVLAATGMAGLCVSRDEGDSWKSITEGFPTGGFGLAYARALVRWHDTVVVTASNGPSTDDAGVYRWSFDSDERVERCTEGLPERFADNIDTGCLATDGVEVAFGTTEGSVYVSDDGGAHWEEVCAGLPAVRSVALT